MDAALEAKGRKCFKIEKLSSKSRQKYAEFKEKLKTKRIMIGRIWFWVDMGKRGRKCFCFIFLWHNWSQVLPPEQKTVIALKMKPRSCSVFPIETICLFWWGRNSVSMNVIYLMPRKNIMLWIQVLNTTKSSSLFSEIYRIIMSTF